MAAVEIKMHARNTEMTYRAKVWYLIKLAPYPRSQHHTRYNEAEKKEERVHDAG